MPWSDEAEVNGQIMSVPVKTALESTPAVELVPLMANVRHHHVPVVDAQRRLIGMVTQADLVAVVRDLPRPNGYPSAGLGLRSPLRSIHT